MENTIFINAEWNVGDDKMPGRNSIFIAKGKYLNIIPRALRWQTFPRV